MSMPAGSILGAIYEVIEEAIHPAPPPHPQLSQEKVRRGLEKNLPRATDVFFAGSMVSGVMASRSSGLDVFVLMHVKPTVPPLTALDALRVLPVSEGSRGTYHGWYGCVDEVECCLIPYLQNDKREIAVPNSEYTAWLCADPNSHCGLVRGLSRVGKLAISFLKEWNYAAGACLRSYFLERIVIDVLNTEHTPDEFHWRLKECLLSVRERLTVAQCLSEITTLCDTGQVISELDRAIGLANNAWFLLEHDAHRNAKDACVLFAEILSPS